MHISIPDKDYYKIYNKCLKSKFHKTTYKKIKVIKLGNNLYKFSKDKIIENRLIPKSWYLKKILNYANKSLRII